MFRMYVYIIYIIMPIIPVVIPFNTSSLESRIWGGAGFPRRAGIRS